MSGNEVRKKYLSYLENRGHAIIPSAALVPDNDPTTLFTGSGMQPLVPYLLGDKHPKGTRLADAQKCFRAEDIEEVGDNRHTTFFEMLGNWSLGDYFKAEQLPWFYHFLVEEIGLDPERIYVTTFIGDTETGVPQDTESVEIWQELFATQGVSQGVAEIGSEADGAARGMRPGERIFYYDASKNWWSRSGTPDKMPAGEIGGPDSEVFYDFDPEGKLHDPEKWGPHCHPNCDCGRFLEIGNSVFIEYIKGENGAFTKLPQQNVDFGGGLERITAAANDTRDVFLVDLLHNIIAQLETLTNKTYDENQEAFRVITDHIRGAVFMIGDGVLPANSEQGYFVRRLLRRSVRYADVLEIADGKLQELATSVIDTYAAHYEQLAAQKQTIVEAIDGEEKQFRKTLESGLQELQKLFQHNSVSAHPQWSVSGKDLFNLYQTHGFPLELALEVIEQTSVMGEDNTLPESYKQELTSAFHEEMQKHKEKSRAGAEQKFKGGLADSSEKVVQYHTATHLLLAAMRDILGTHVHQAGSNITSERLRFDVTHPEKISAEELEKIECRVNQALETGGKISIETMDKSVAENDPSVEGSFWDRYPDEVKVYTIIGNDGTVYSRELCGGPHVEHLSDIKGTFDIKKEESSAAGVRRIKAVLHAEYQ
jgi:alanyl-tRNA synthetase